MNTIYIPIIIGLSIILFISIFLLLLSSHPDLPQRNILGKFRKKPKGATQPQKLATTGTFGM